MIEIKIMVNKLFMCALLCTVIRILTVIVTHRSLDIPSVLAYSTSYA